MNSNTRQLECDAILFDLDGVLIDSTACIYRHWKEWADGQGLDADEIMRAAHGVRTIETIRRFAPQLDAEKEAALYNAREVADTVGVVAVEGASRLLTALPEGRWAIVTSCSTELAKARLGQANLPIPRVLVTADDVRQGKPAPEAYLVGANWLGIAVEKCVVVEDALAGIEAGKKAGMRVVAVITDFTGDELAAAGANIVIDLVAQLKIRETADGRALIVSVE